MAVTTTQTNKPLNPRGNDQSPKGYNRAELYSGKALDFDGVNDSVSGADSLPTSNYTICSYFKVETFGGSHIVFQWGENTAGKRRAMLIWTGGSGTAMRVVSSTSSSNIAGDTELEAGRWYFACISVDDSGNANIYVNGQHDGSGVNTLNSYTAGNYYVGAVLGAGEWMNGQIANTRVFNQVLTAAQVADLYNNPEKVVPTGVDDSALKLWLPMQEGAGTTAYDGSGNGNHGTISGATYVHGIGAPVSQTAVIDWNKGTNLLGYTDISNAYWTKLDGTLTTGIEAPDGTNTAFKFERDDSSSGTIYTTSVPGLGGTNYRYVYAKLPSGSANASAQLMSNNANTNNTFTITDEWQRFELNSTSIAPGNFYIVDFRGGVGVDEIHLWAPQAAAGTTESVFVPTIGTTQANPVLLPQGLTTGRDITGVNLFENVRKQGALNLDGNSWAEVHDNGSLDFGTGSFSLEAWAKVKYVNQGSSINVIMTLGNEAVSTNSSGLSVTSSDTAQIWYSGNSSSSSPLTEGDWIHIVGVYDETNATLYVNGSQVDQDARTAASITNTLVKEIGRDTSGVRYYNDQIAQPRIYNRALTAEEVLQNYNSGKSIYK